MEIENLKPFAKKIDLIAKVISKNEVREVTSKLDDSTHKVTEALIADKTGGILLTLWDSKIDEVQIGKTYTIQNAYTSLFKNSLRLNIGRFGKIDESGTMDSTNESNNLSDIDQSRK